MADQATPRKQVHTARNGYRRLMKLAQEEKTEFDISDRSIRTVVKQLRPELNQSKLDSLPRLHPAGEAQVGFGTTLFLQGRHLL